MKKVFKWVVIVIAILFVAGVILGVVFGFDKIKDNINKVKNNIEDTINDYLTDGETDQTEDINGTSSSIGAVSLSLGRSTESDQSTNVINEKYEIWFEPVFIAGIGEYLVGSESFQVIGNYTAALSPFREDIQGKEVTQCLKLESSTSVSFSVVESSYVYFLSTALSVKIDDTTVHKNGTAQISGANILYYYSLKVDCGTHVLTKDSTGTLYYMCVCDADLYNDKGEQTYKYRYGITLTPNPYFAEVSSDWSLSWINPDSEWASGKDIYDYVIFKGTCNTGSSLYCLQNFSESILLTVTGEIYIGEMSKEFTSYCRVECVGTPLDYWNGGDKYVDSLDEDICLDDFVVENGTIAPSYIRSSVYCNLVTGAGADYYPIYGYGFTIDDVDSVLTLNGIFTRCDRENDSERGYTLSELMDYYSSMGEINANEYYKILTFDCDMDTYFEYDDRTVDYGTLHIKHDIYLRGSALLALI